MLVFAAKKTNKNSGVVHVSSSQTGTQWAVVKQINLIVMQVTCIVFREGRNNLSICVVDHVKGSMCHAMQVHTIMLHNQSILFIFHVHMSLPIIHFRPEAVFMFGVPLTIYRTHLSCMKIYVHISTSYKFKK